MSNLGLGGLVSGINTDGILDKLMQMENARIDLERAKKANLAAKQDAWHKVKSSLETLRSKLDAIRFVNSFRTRKATLTDESVATVTAASGATATTHSLSVTQLAQAQVMRSTASVPFADGDTLDFGGGKTVTVTSADTLYSLRDKINALTDGPVKAEVVNVTTATGTTAQLVLTAKETGATGFTATGNVATALGLTTTTSAQNAVFTLDGQAYETSTNTISDAVPGLSITLKKADPAGATTDITVGQDTGAAVDAVKAWVDAFNSTMGTLKSLTSYDTSTKAKGVLNGDSLARNIMNSLRSSLSDNIPGLPAGSSNLSDVGVSTGAWGTADYGKVVVDTTKLTAKLTADEDAVARIFGALRVENNLTPAGSTPWVSAPVTATSPQTLQIDLGSAKSIDQINLYNADGVSTTAGLKDFKLSYQNTSTGAWTELQSVTGFSAASRSFSFDPVTTQFVKLEVTATYADTAAQVSDLQILESNRGAAVQMYRYVDGTLAYGTGALDTRDSTYSGQLKALDEKIGKMSEHMAAQQARLKAQFDRMEAALAKIQTQGSQLAAMMGMSQK